MDRSAHGSPGPDNALRQLVYYFFRTRKGTVEIVPRADKWHIIYDDDDLGNYPSPRAAAHAAAGGLTLSPGNGVDLGLLEIPTDIKLWNIAKHSSDLPDT